EALNARVTFKNSIHQLDMLETLAYAELLGNRPETVVIGVEPEDISPWGDELTAVIRSKMSELIDAVLNEIEIAGGSYKELEGGA
ncbi:MAG: hydrogenase expression/formation protein, partial [Syntrophobacteraceae bacterium]